MILLDHHMNQLQKKRAREKKKTLFFTMGRQTFEAKSQSIEHHMRVSMKTFESSTLTFLLILFEEDKSAYKMMFFCFFS